MKRQFDPNNKIVKLCAEGMEMEASGMPKAALILFQQAWEESTNDFEKFTAAHYVARHQESILEKLKWDEIALNLAQGLDYEDMKVVLPSLHLNVGKCYEDLNDTLNAKKHYESGYTLSTYLPNDHYGRMIKGGLMNGLDRITGIKI